MEGKINIPTVPSLYFFRHNNSAQGSELINRLALGLLENSSSLKLVPKLLGIYEEEIYTFQHKSMNIALIAEVNNTYYLSSILAYLYQKQSVLVFINPFLFKEPIEVISAASNIESYRPVQLQNIFNTFVKIEGLVDYQVEKLIDIVTLSLDVAEEEWTCNNDHLFASSAS